MKLKRNSFILPILCLFLSFSISAQDCIIEDPLIVNDEIESCPCEVTWTQTDVCYDISSFAPNSGIKLKEFHYPGGSWIGEITYTYPSELAGILNSLLPPDLGIEFQSEADGDVCAYNIFFSDFGNIVIDVNIGGNIQEQIIAADVTSFTQTYDCDELLDDVDFEAFGPNAGTPADLPVLETASGDVISTHDVVFGGSNPDYNGPSPNAVGNLLNAVVESGLLQSGASCENINCIDLVDLFNTHFSSIAGSIDDNLDTEESAPSGYASWSAYIQDQVSNQLGDPQFNLAGFINDNTGWNIPEEGCGGTLIGADDDRFNHEDNRSDERSVNVNVPTESEYDYFNQDIPGLGLVSGDVSNPSPTAMEMIKQVKGGVNLYNGAQNSSIPLYNVMNNDVSVPISLNSSNNGLKVNDLGSIVGQNWNLNAGGMITRVVKGIPDDFVGKVTGEGKGKIYVPQLIMDTPSSFGFLFDFPGAEGVQCPPTLIDQIRRGATLDGNAFIRVSYTPLRPGVVTFNLTIPIYTIPIIDLTVFLQMGFDVGIDLNQKVGKITYEEELTGLQHLEQADIYGLLNFNTLDADGKRLLLERIHPRLRRDDNGFLSDIFADWNNWHDAMQNIFEGSVKYQTSRIDTEPDEFYFNIEGYSGKFYINADDKITMIPYFENLEITPLDLTYLDGNGESKTIFGGFTIKTPSGMEYQFGGGGADPFYAIDLTTDINYYLPNFYTYPENQTSGQSPLLRDEFLAAQIDEAILMRRGVLGPRKVVTYGETYERNYKRMSNPQYASSWHLVQKKSLLSQDAINIEYTKRDPLAYYSSKSFTHSFPNFTKANGMFYTSPSDVLNPFHQQATKWKNGRAEFSYTAVKTELVRWDVTEINNQRNEKILFSYDNYDRGEVVGDKMCDKIMVYRNELPFKGWGLKYSTMSEQEASANCSDEWSVLESTAPLIGIPNEFKFDLGNNYEVKNEELNDYSYFFLTFQVGCLRIPIRLAKPAIMEQQDYGHRTQMSEFGSLMEVKLELGEGNLEKEEAIFNAEMKRTFLTCIQEIDRNLAFHDFVTLSYVGQKQDLRLPKRFSDQQDVFGYFNDNPSKSFLPRVQYVAVDGSILNPVDHSELHGHFPFSAPNASNPIWQGQNTIANGLLAERSALQKIELATGASISYTYEINEMPVGGTLVEGAGVRVKQMTESPGDMPAKVTKYKYEQPAVTGTPIRLNNVEHDHYLFDLEKRITTTSNIQNELLPNGNGYVGYGLVTEEWDGIGRSDHYFMLPEQLHYDSVTYRLLKTSKKSVLATDVNSDEEIFQVPPGLLYSRIHEHQSYRHGVEFKNEIFAGTGTPFLIKRHEWNYAFPFAPDEGLKRFKSTMYQENHPGEFICNFGFRTLKNYLPFTLADDTPDISLIMILFIIDLMDNGVLDHPCKQIDRDYYVSANTFHSGGIQLVSTETTDFFQDNTMASVRSDYTYDAGYNCYESAREVTTGYWNSDPTTTLPLQTTRIVNYFSFDDFGQLGLTDEADAFESLTLNYLNNFSYNRPLFSKTYLTDGTGPSTLIAENLVGLGQLSNGRVVPRSSWEIRDGNLVLKGRFTDHESSNGKPTEYRIAHHGVGLADAVDNTNYYPAVVLAWNGQNQLTSRTYEAWTSSYVYDPNTFELRTTTDPDGVTNQFDYDSRGRLEAHDAQSGLQTMTYAYTIAPGDNKVISTTAFQDGSPTQIQTQRMDGFGRDLGATRDNDGAILSAMTYDNFFRLKSQYAMGKGWSEIDYEASPIPRVTTVTDAIGNVVTTLTTGSTGDYIGATLVTDPNGHTTAEYLDGIGRKRKYTSGAGGSTTYDYDELSRLSTITNPIGETYDYDYNAIGQVYTKKIPGATPVETWWDEALRPVMTLDGNGYQLMEYDDYNRVTRIVRPNAGFSPTELSSDILLEDAYSFVFTSGELLLENEYVTGSTWLERSTERIMTENGYQGEKVTENITFDAIGRPTQVSVTYPQATILADHVYRSFGPVDHSDYQFSFQTGQTPIEYNYRQQSYYDDLLRSSKSTLRIGLPTETPNEVMLNSLFYNAFDQVVTKFVGGTENLPLQKVDYRYDAIGRLTHINSPAELECLLTEEYCTLSAKLFIQQPYDECVQLTSVIVEGQSYPLNPAADILDADLEEILNAALEAAGYEGEVSQDVNISAFGISIDLRITNTAAQDIQFSYADCNGQVTTFFVEECCENETDPGSGQNPNGQPSTDLYYQMMTYDGIDINRIEINSDCSVGTMRNDYTYDGDHRVLTMKNTLFNPSVINDAYSTSYQYDPAGNIERLSRRGLIDVQNNQPVFADIDELQYIYSNERLGYVGDLITDPVAQPHGFKPTASTYTYDANGNIINDSGKGLTIDYNLLNLPRAVSGTAGNLGFHYAYGGEKILKSGPTEDRHYLGGFEIIESNGGFYAECFSHGEGRVRFKGEDQIWDFRLSDHLGNTVVLFTDIDGDGYISPDLSNDSDPDNDEVLQRNLYYPFGMPLDGQWDAMTQPRMDYLYNGKELQEELGLDWYSYGFREYDPAIGRFPSVDPIANKFAHVSPFNYAENRVPNGIDLWGLQFASAEIIHEEFRTVVNLSAEIKVVNNSSNMSDEELGRFVTQAQSAINEFYSINFGIIKFNMNISLTIATSADIENDLFIELVDIIPGITHRGPDGEYIVVPRGFAGFYPGNTQKGKVQIATKEKLPSFMKKDLGDVFKSPAGEDFKTIIGVTIHELGHKITGMTHLPDYPDLMKETIGNNFLLEGSDLEGIHYSKWEVLLSQYLKAFQNVYEQAGFINKN